MLEQEHYTTPEHTNQQAEELPDVMSLKQIDMSVDDYNQFVDMDVDDPRVTNLLSQYEITPGEFVTVSATDIEHPENSLLRVVSMGEDMFTTNRSLTNELEARLLEESGKAERVRTEEDSKEIGGATLDAVGVEAPHVVSERDASYRALMEAKGVFDKQFSELIREYVEASNLHKQEIGQSAEDLIGVQRRLEEASEEAYRSLFISIDQPDRIRYSVDRALEELSSANRLLSTTTDIIESGRTASNNLHNQTEAHATDVRQLQGGFRVTLGEIAHNTTSLDQTQLAQIDTEVTEMVLSQTTKADHLESEASAIRSTLGRIGEEIDTTQRRMRSLLGQLEELKVKLHSGRLSSTEYEGMVQVANGLRRNVQDNSLVRRFAAAAEGL